MTVFSNHQEALVEYQVSEEDLTNLNELIKGLSPCSFITNTLFLDISIIQLEKAASIRIPVAAICKDQFKKCSF